MLQEQVDMSRVVLLVLAPLLGLCVSMSHYPCPRGWVHCGESSQCVHTGFFCNGNPSCDNGWDELNCSQCYGDSFLCDGSRCVQAAHRCDGVSWCQDNADERGCTSELLPATCPAASRCNGIRYDCWTSDDEIACTAEMCQEPASSSTYCDGRCFQSSQWCDGDVDCSDGQDEAYCETTSTLSTTVESETEQTTQQDEIWVPRTVTVEPEVLATATELELDRTRSTEQRRGGANKKTEVRVTKSEASQRDVVAAAPEATVPRQESATESGNPVPNIAMMMYVQVAPKGQLQYSANLLQMMLLSKGRTINKQTRDSAVMMSSLGEL